MLKTLEMCPICKTSVCNKTKGVTNPFNCSELVECIIIEKKAIKII